MSFVGPRHWLALALGVLLCAGAILGAPTPAAAADANLELMVRLLPDGRLEPSCLVELLEITPAAARTSALAGRLESAGLTVTTAPGSGRWLLTVAAPAPQVALPAALADGIIVRCEVRRWGPVVVWRTYLSIGGPDGFLAQFRSDLGAGLPEIAAALGERPPAVGGGLNLPSAVRIQVPGRVIASSAPAKAGDALHWDVKLDDDAVVLAEVSSLAVLPGALGLWLLALALVAGAVWAGADVFLRSSRSRHGPRP